VAPGNRGLKIIKTINTKDFSLRCDETLLLQLKTFQDRKNVFETNTQSLRKEYRSVSFTANHFERPEQVFPKMKYFLR